MGREEGGIVCFISSAVGNKKKKERKRKTEKVEGAAAP
jgi:hypothetical protein